MDSEQNEKVVELSDEEIEKRIEISRHIAELNACVEKRIAVAKRNDRIFKIVMGGVALSWISFLIVAVNKLEKLSAEESES